MTNLETYLNDSSTRFPQNISNGIPSEWMLIGDIEIATGSIWSGDPFVANEEDGCLAQTPNGEYIIEAKGYDYDGFRVIGRLRARLNKAENYSPGNKIGETGTDSALIAICDMRQMDSAIDGINDVIQAVIDSFNFGRFGVLEFEMSEPVKIIYANSGFGDGVGAVFELLDSHNQRVGIELDFIGNEDY